MTNIKKTLGLVVLTLAFIVVGSAVSTRLVINNAFREGERAQRLAQEMIDNSRADQAPVIPVKKKKYNKGITIEEVSELARAKWPTFEVRNVNYSVDISSDDTIYTVHGIDTKTNIVSTVSFTLQGEYLSTFQSYKIVGKDEIVILNKYVR